MFSFVGFVFIFWLGGFLKELKLFFVVTDFRHRRFVILIFDHFSFHLFFSHLFKSKFLTKLIKSKFISDQQQFSL
jgi:hypothetical protein